MQISQASFLSKTNTVFTSVARNTSCNRGWLQLFTHILCGVFTAACFVVILLGSLPAFKRRTVESRCQDSSCRIVCHGAPYYGEYEDDIVMAVMEAEVYCHHIFLSLYEPAFNNESLPENWLARLRPNVIELSIIGGNLQHIPRNVFSAPFTRHVKILLLENVTISSWTQHMLVGLANLENLFIKNCNIIKVQENALTPVGQTLTALTVMRSGHFDPTWLTGFTPKGLLHLNTVDLSSNVFGSILGNKSFTRLRSCKSLYLSSSRITYIGPGAFNRLDKIQYLNLDKNFLQTLEPRLFNTIALHNNARINLADNPWHCNCADSSLRRLIKNGALLVDPTCHSPSILRGETFTKYDNYCKKEVPRKLVVVDVQSSAANVNDKETIHTIDCMNDNSISLDMSGMLVSPFKNYECPLVGINNSNLLLPYDSVNIYDNLNNFWMQLSLIISGTDYTIIELEARRLEGYGLVWYRTSCPDKVFCVNVVPEVIRFYNMNLTDQYTFCPIMLKSGTVDHDQCIAYSSTSSKKVSVWTMWSTYAMIAVSCLFFGALCLYVLIRQYPSLLKGSKRLLFVKHKTVDALVLPPKVPLRSSLLSDNSLVQFNGMRVAEPLHSDLMTGRYARSGSIRSSTSYAPSYISALQPSVEQLANWREKHGNEIYDGNYATISIISSDMTPISILSGSENLYFSLEESSSCFSNSSSISNS